MTDPRRSPAASLLGAALLAPALLACAQQPAPPLPGLRVRVATVAEWSDVEQLARRVSQAAGTPVRDAAGIAPRAFTLTLTCADPAACDRALAQLALARELVTEAVPDRRMTIPRPILPDSPQAR
jgi:hypothetical protein